VARAPSRDRTRGGPPEIYEWRVVVTAGFVVVRTPLRRFRAGAGVGAGVARVLAVVATGGCSGAVTSFTFARA